MIDLPLEIVVDESAEPVGDPVEPLARLLIELFQAEEGER